jgi:CRISPR type III-A/MTUBE-associated protein Csm6
VDCPIISALLYIYPERRMMMFVLFSPIGNTDPIRDDFDGPMLHIVRHYKPGKIYLFLTKLMGKYDRATDCYARSIFLLYPGCRVEKTPNIEPGYNSAKVYVGNDLVCEIVKEYTDIADPSDFDAFQSSIAPILDKIYRENQEAEILLNVTSGSPQIQMTLGVEIASSEIKFTPVQVKNPRKAPGTNMKHFDPNKDDLEECFKNNLDSADDLEGVVNRCSIPPIIVLRRSVIRNQVKSLIDSYDYKQAYKLATDNGKLIKEKVLQLLKHAYFRSRLDYEKAEAVARGLGIHDELYPVHGANAKTVCEYYLIVKMKTLRGELTDALLRIFPLAEHLGEKYLEKCLRIQNRNGTAGFTQGLDTIARKKTSGSWVLETNKAEKNFSGIVKHIDDSYVENTEHGYTAWNDINLETMIYIMEFKAPDEKFACRLLNRDIIDMFKTLQRLKQDRNDSAHQIVEAGLENFASIGPAPLETLISTAEKLICEIFGSEIKSTNIFDVYDEINKRIKVELDL